MRGRSRSTTKDGTVQIVMEIANNMITCIWSAWAQLFHSWEMHLHKVKISHKPVFLPKAFVLSVLSSLIYLLMEQDLAQHKPAMKWKTATALLKSLLKQRTRMTVVKSWLQTSEREQTHRRSRNSTLGSSPNYFFGDALLADAPPQINQEDSLASSAMNTAFFLFLFCSLEIWGLKPATELQNVTETPVHVFKPWPL